MEMGDIYGLLRWLGLSAESTRFFHVSYAVYLTTRQPARIPFAEWWLYPAVAGHYHTCIFDVERSVCFAVDWVWDGRMSGKAIHRCSCGKSEMSKSWRKRSARMRHLRPLQRLRRTDG